MWKINTCQLEVLPRMRREDIALAKGDKSMAGQNTAGQNTPTPQKSRRADRNLLTIGALFFIIIISFLLYYPAKLYGAIYIIPAIIGFFGAWLEVLSYMQHSNPEKYGRGAFSYFGWGLLLMAVGGACFLDGYGYGIYAFALVLLVLGGLAIAAAFRRK